MRSSKDCMVTYSTILTGMATLARSHFQLSTVVGTGSFRYSRSGRIDTEIAAGALVGNDGVHRLGGADDGVDRTGLDALGAADALIFMNEGDFLDGDGGFGAAQRLGFDPHQVGNLAHGGIATWHALVDLVAIGQRLGVGLAAR